MVALAVVGCLSVSVAAHAEDPQADHQPCVSNRESHSNTVYGMDRADVERRWEVTGKGILAVNALGWTVVAYPWCGHQFHNHSPLPYEYVGIVYSGRGRLRIVTWSHAPLYWDGGQVAEPEPTPIPTEEPQPTQPCTAKCPPPMY
jgi:hypothetical protein